MHLFGLIKLNRQVCWKFLCINFFITNHPYFSTIHTSTHILLESDIPLEVQPSSNEHIVRRSIPQPKPTNNLQVQYDQRQPSTSPERTARQQRRYERRQPPSSSHDQMIRPTIPQPTSKSYDPSDRQEVRRNRRQAHPTNYEPFTQPSASRPMSTSPDLVYQQELSRDRQRPLPLSKWYSPTILTY